ncbi:MAG: hypothetical protein RSG52_10655 [Terrisporobacter sp.]|uniref:hypothetical protein n=1 Tax=Terrisporobacter sp. TaxID=1965305 RepID=UPI002FCAF7F6
MIIGLNNNYLEVISLSQIRSKFYIETHNIYDMKLNLLLSKDKSHYKQELLNKIRKDIDINKNYNGIFFNIQNEQIIIRNIENIKSKKQNHIIGLIKCQINQYMPIDLQNYSIKYKTIKDENKQELIQGILVPKNIINLCLDLSQELDINNKHLNIDFDILERLIKLKLINGLHEDKISYIIKNRKDDLIINATYNKQVIESHIRIKNDRTKAYLENLCESNSVYYYGVKDKFIEEIHMSTLRIKSKLNIHNNGNDKEITTKYISALGMII